MVKADDPHKIITGVHLTSGGYRVPWKQLVKEGGLRAAIVSENQPLKRAKLYQTQTGVLFAAGQIQNGWLSNARAALAKWKNDKPAWDSHKSASGRRKKGPRKITILRKASAIVQKIRNSAA